MGTDIHTAAEFRRGPTKPWEHLGAAFESTHDWNFVYPGEPHEVRQALEGLPPARVIEALGWTLLPYEGERGAMYGVPEKSAFKELMTDAEWESVLPVLERYGEAEKVFRARCEKLRQAWYDSKESGHEACERLLRAPEREARRDFYEGFEADPKAVATLISAACAYHQGETEKAAAESQHYKDAADAGRRGEGLSLDFHLAAGDPPFPTVEPFDARNYDAFAALADVRNGSGFAGVDTGDAIKPIAMPRGIPEDADPKTVACLSHEHTPSWLTLRELEEYDWDMPKASRGIASGALFDIMREVGTDYPWDERVVELAKERGVDATISGGISGGGIRVFTVQGYDTWLATERPYIREAPRSYLGPDTTYGPEDVRSEAAVAAVPTATVAEDEDRPQLMAGTGVDDGGNLVGLYASGGGIKPYVRIQWMRPLRDSVSDELFAGIAATRRIADELGIGPDDIRWVFDFDS